MKHCLVERVGCYRRHCHFTDFLHGHNETDPFEWSDYHDWPDDPHAVALSVLLRVYRATDWFAWRREKRLRQQKGWKAWLSPIGLS